MKKEIVPCVSSLPLLATLACGSTSEPPPTGALVSVGSARVAITPAPTEVPVVAATALPRSSEAAPSFANLAAARAALEPYSVDASRGVARRVLYSWTTRPQAETIVAGGPLLTREESARFGPSGFDWAIDALVARGDALGKLLFHQGFAKKRFAWANGFATSLGGGGGRYGSVLLQIELEADSLVVDLTTKKVLTVTGEAASLKDLEAHPERLGAVYWEGPGYREYVIMNEASIAKVSFGTAEVLAVFEKEKSVLGQVDAALDRFDVSDSTALLKAFSRTLAFHPNAYRELVAELAREAKESPPDTLAFSFTPSTELTLGAVRPRLKNPKCTVKKTFDMSFSRTACLPADRCAFTATGVCDVSRQPLTTE